MTREAIVTSYLLAVLLGQTPRPWRTTTGSDAAAEKGVVK